MAYTLGKGARARLIGEAADPEVQRAVNELLQQQPEIDSVTSLPTVRLGPGSVLLAASVDLTAGYDRETVEDAMVRIRAELQGRRPSWTGCSSMSRTPRQPAAQRAATGARRGPEPLSRTASAPRCG
ncbi:hypothetical protein AB0C90_02800 [Streptomyces sp. NPDC048550]|uniref:hypothetical protein n=1 Tax=Streptomyces sp. NPDC048550 TaxID=3155739 RepID=UPI0034306B2D